MEVVWKFFKICKKQSFLVSQYTKYGVFTSFLEDVPSSNLGPGTIIKHLTGAFLMSYHRCSNDRLCFGTNRSDDCIVYIISGVLETIIGQFLWYGSGMEVHPSKVGIKMGTDFPYQDTVTN